MADPPDHDALTPAVQAERLWAAAWMAAGRATSVAEVARIEAELQRALAALGQAHRYPESLGTV